MASGLVAAGLGVALLLVAVVFREEIGDAVRGAWNSSPPTDGGSKGASPSPSRPTDPPVVKDTELNGDARPKEKAKEAEEKEEEEEEYFFNPPFDPSASPAPMYSESGARLITKNELAAHGPEGPLKPVWLAIAGKVFDVEKGAKNYYGEGGGYSFFSGRDGTRAFVTGKFDEEGLTDNLTGLSPLEIGEIEDWVHFYEKDYVFVGKLIGRFYTKTGSPTRAWYRYQKALGQKDEIKAEQKRQQQQFPGCNSKWNEKDGGLVYCSEKRYEVQGKKRSSHKCTHTHTHKFTCTYTHTQWWDSQGLGRLPTEVLCPRVLLLALRLHSPRRPQQPTRAPLPRL